MDPENIMTGISKEIEATLKAMETSKNPEEKLIHSKIVKNLCESLGIFLGFAGDMMPYDEDGESLPF